MMTDNLEELHNDELDRVAAVEIAGVTHIKKLHCYADPETGDYNTFDPEKMDMSCFGDTLVYCALVNPDISADTEYDNPNFYNPIATPTSDLNEAWKLVDELKFLKIINIEWEKDGSGWSAVTCSENDINPIGKADNPARALTVALIRVAREIKGANNHE